MSINASYIIKLIIKESTGCYNVGTGKGITIKDFVQSLSSKKIDFQIDEQEQIHFLIADITNLKNEIVI